MTTDLQARVSEAWHIQNAAKLRAELARLTDTVERLEIDREASGVALRDMHSKWETAAKNEAKADALAEMLKSVDTKTLVDMADEYECEENCKNRGPMDMETGVVDCRLDNAGVGCRFVIAEEMRDFAWAKQAALTDYQGDGK